VPSSHDDHGFVCIRLNGLVSAAMVLRCAAAVFRRSLRLRQPDDPQTATRVTGAPVDGRVQCGKFVCSVMSLITMMIPKNFPVTGRRVT